MVTLNPPTNSPPSKPKRASIWLIWGPPPWTTTGFAPTVRKNTMSAANAFFRSSSIMALPPYLTTTILSR